MKTKLIAALLAAALAQVALPSQAQVAGSQTLGITVQESTAILGGWSIKKSILNKPVVNENGDRVGVIYDIIVAPDKSVSFAIVAASQFAGVSHHDVAIPIEQLDIVGGKIVLAGGTKAAIKALPEFEYAKMPATPKPRADFPDHH